MHRRHVIALLMAASAAVQAQTPAQPPYGGRWITESGNLEIEIAPCGELLCGSVTRVIANRSMSEPGKAAESADKRPLMGMKILTDLRPSGKDALDGQIYNRENGKTYSVRLNLDGPQQLLVRPYVGLPLIGKTQLWRKVEAAEASKP